MVEKIRPVLFFMGVFLVPLNSVGVLLWTTAAEP